MPLPEALNGSRWTELVARVIFPWLLWSAKNHRTIYYSDLDAEIVSRRIHHHVNFVQYGHPAGAVGDALLEIGKVLGEDIPPLNAIIVAKTGPEAGMPSEGCDWYLNKFLKQRINFKKLSIPEVRHECDVAVVHKSEADICRANQVLPRSSKVLLAVECKYYVNSNPGLGLARGFLGLREEIQRENRFFIATSHSKSVEKLLAKHTRDYELKFTPVIPHNVDVTRSVFESVFAKFIGQHS